MNYLNIFMSWSGWLNIGSWLNIGISVIGGIRIVTTMTPNKTRNKFFNGILQILNLLSLAVGKNKVA